ncbi:hypothetical protein CA603_26650 [Paraburkholderia hospita]|nr:hypothetical protein CA603_26650 [Paraburkholderia hospita]
MVRSRRRGQSVIIDLRVETGAKTVDLMNLEGVRLNVQAFARWVDDDLKARQLIWPLLLINYIMSNYVVAG